MKFFNQQMIEVHFSKAILKRKEDTRIALLQFSTSLNGNTMRSTPKFIQLAYATVKDLEAGVESAELSKKIAHQSVDLYKHPELKSNVIRFQDIELTQLSLSRGDNDKVQLHFNVEIPIDKACGEWILEQYGTDIWAEFSECQAEMFAEDDPKTKATKKAAAEKVN